MVGARPEATRRGGAVGSALGLSWAPGYGKLLFHMRGPGNGPRTPPFSRFGRATVSNRPRVPVALGQIQVLADPGEGARDDAGGLVDDRHDFRVRHAAGPHPPEHAQDLVPGWVGGGDGAAAPPDLHRVLGA